MLYLKKRTEEKKELKLQCEEFDKTNLKKRILKRSNEFNRDKLPD